MIKGIRMLPNRPGGWALLLAPMLLAMAVLAAGCGGGGSSSSSTDATSSGGSSGSASSEEAVSSGEAEGEPIKVGFASAMTGGLVVSDIPVLEGAKLAMKEINESGGVDGRKIEAVVSDSQSDPAKAGTAANDVISKGADAVVTACDYDVGQGAARAATKAGVVSMQCAGGELAGLKGLGSLHFNVQPGTAAEGTVLAQFATEQGYKKVAALEDTEFSYGTDLCKFFTQEFEARGGEVLETQEFKASETSIPNQVASLTNAGADAILVCAFLPSGGSAIKQIRDVSPIPIISGIGMDGTGWLKGIRNPSEIYVAAAADRVGDDPHPEINEYFKNLEEFSGKTPENALSIYGYDIVALLAKGIEEAGTTEGEALAAAIEEFTDVDVLGEKFTYSKDCHFSPRPYPVMQIQNGELKFKTVPKVTKFPPIC